MKSSIIEASCDGLWLKAAIAQTPHDQRALWILDLSTREGARFSHDLTAEENLAQATAEL